MSPNSKCSLRFWIFAIMGIYCAKREAFCSYYAPESPPLLYVHDAYFVPDRVLRISAQNYVTDCVVRYSVLINGTSPGPELRFREGEKVWIRVFNDMNDQNVTIHWHGLTQRMSPFSDGTPMGSQWPIPPLHYFDYEFQLFPGDAGTYFYHSHVGFGAVTAFGALIVDEPVGVLPPYEYNDERVLLISDAFHLNDSDVEEGLLANPFRWSGETNNIQLNGKSRFINASASQFGPRCSLGLITISPESVYRFRFIGATALSQVFIAIEAHLEMLLIEVDGLYVAPFPIDHIEIHSGQRYSVLLRARTSLQLQADRASNIQKYWIQMETRSRALITTSYAILTYDFRDPQFPNQPIDLFDNPADAPLVLPPETFTNGWIEEAIEPLYVEELREIPRLEDVTRRVYVNVQQVFGAINGSVIWVQNQYPWFENIPKEPYLVSLYKNSIHYFPDYTAALSNGGFDIKTKTFPAKIGEVLEIVWLNLGNTQTGTVETHPMHAHGDHFYDIGSGAGIYDPILNEAKIGRRVLAKRDTTNLYRTRNPENSPPGSIYSWRAWRLRVQNPGVWMVHCHILQHMVMGMQTVWVFGEPSDLTPLSPAQAAGYLTFSGSSYGNASYAPQVVHYWHD